MDKNKLGPDEHRQQARQWLGEAELDWHSDAFDVSGTAALIAIAHLLLAAAAEKGED